MKWPNDERFRECGAIVEITSKGKICRSCPKPHSVAVANTNIYGEWSRTTRTDAMGIESDFLQPLKRDGTINPHFVQVHGTKKLQKEMKLTEKQIRENIEKPRATARELAAENGHG